MPVILKNNASSTLATGATASDTGIVVASGSAFPTITAGNYFYVTLVSQTGQTEIVKVTARVGNSMTVVRAQDGSTAASFQAGTLVEMRTNVASVLDSNGDYTTFDTVAILLADTALAYTTVSAGVIVRTRSEGFAYEVAASAATDHNVATAGGVKLYVLPMGAGQYGGIWPLAALGIDFTGVTNATTRIQSLVNTASAAGGGQLFHPGGTILCAGVAGKAGVGLLGIGQRSLFKRHTSSADTIEWQDAEAVDVTVENCAFDLAADANFRTCLRFDDFRTGAVATEANKVTVNKCYFFNSLKATGGADWTNSAIQCRGINEVTVTDNIADGVQFKLGGAAANSINILCSGNTFRDGQAFSVSCVVRGEGGVELRNVKISNNIFDGWAGGAVFVGYDSGSGGALIMENVEVTNNQFTASNYGAAAGRDVVCVVFRMPTTGGLGGYRISENTFTIPVGLTTPGTALIFQAGGDGNDILFIDNNVFCVFSDISRTLSTGNRCHFIDNIVYRGTTLVCNAADDYSVFSGNKFYGLQSRLNRIQYEASATYINVTNNEWVDCPLPAGFQVGLLQLSSSVTASGLVASNKVTSPNVITEAFVSEGGAGAYTIRYADNFVGPGIKLFDAKRTPNNYLYGNIVVDENAFRVSGALSQVPLSADPANPAAGESTLWVSDGTGAGDPGDVMMKINVGGTTKTITLVDYSAA